MVNDNANITNMIDRGGHPTHIVCPCTYGRPQDCGFNQRVEPFVPYVLTPRQDQILEWQEAWQRITQPKPLPRPWRGICPPIGAGRAG